MSRFRGDVPLVRRLCPSRLSSLCATLRGALSYLHVGSISLKSMCGFMLVLCYNDSLSSASLELAMINKYLRTVRLLVHSL